jgi:uncharacterized membrane protein
MALVASAVVRESGMKLPFAGLGDAQLARAARCIGLLAAEGASLSLFLQEAFRGRWLAAFISRNELAFSARNRLLLTLVAGALIPVVAALVLLARRGPAALDTLDRTGKRLALTLVLWAFPPLLVWDAWDGRDFAFLLAAGAIVLATERAARITLQAFGVPIATPEAAPRPGGRAPHIAVAVAVIFYIAYFSYYSILQHRLLATASFDLGYFDELFWNTMHGRPFYAPITHPKDGSYLSIHAEFAVYPLLPFYMLRPGAETLLVMQAALCGSSAVPLYLFARRRLKSDWLPALIALAFLCYPPLHGPNLCDFHFLTLSVFFVLWAVYFFEARRTRLFWVAVVMCLLCREDVPFGVIACGVALALSGAAVRTGVALAALGSVYVLVVKFVIMAHYGTSFLYIYEGLAPPGDPSFAGVIKTIITNPLFTFASLFTMPKAIFFLQVMVPLAFLPLRRKTYYFLLFPGFFVTLLSTGYWPITNIGFQYVTHFTPYVFVGAVLVIERLGVEVGRFARPAAALAMAAGTLVATHHYGGFQQDHFYAGGSRRAFVMTDADREQLRNLTEIAATIPGTASVSATENDGPHLARREYMFTLKYDINDADYLLYSYRNLDVGKARELVRSALGSGTYGLHAERPGYVVLRKGAPTTRNLELAGKL